MSWHYPECPFCGSGNLRVDSTPAGLKVVRCYDCQACGPSKLTNEEAETAWKERRNQGRSQRDEARAERDAAYAALEHDRARVIVAHNAISDAFARRAWLIEGGRGNYEWDDDRFRDEFGAAMAEIKEAMKPLRAIGSDWSHCPRSAAEIASARDDIASQRDEARAEATRLTTLLRNALYHVESEGDDTLATIIRGVLESAPPASGR